MKVIQHSVFSESAVYRFAEVLSSGLQVRRLRAREKIRQQVEKFINEIGVENIISISEHASSLGPFSVVVWWHREMPETETLVVRAADASAKI